MKILVTGAYGFIGTNFVHHLLGLDPSAVKKVVTLDKCTYAGNPANLASLRENGQLIEVTGGIGDYALVSRLLHEHQIDAVVNFAAESHVDRSIDSPEIFFQTNVIDTLRLLDACRHYHKALWGAAKEAFRVLHVSTDEVYGSLKSEDDAFTETTAYAPNSPYAASKASSDFIVRSYFHTYGLPVLTTNCSNNYGPFQFPEKLIPLMIIKALREEPLTLYGDGKNVRDWLHVNDHCHALWTVLRRGRIGETYNVGGLCEKTNVEVVDEICHVLQSLLKPQRTRHFHGLKAFVQDRPGHDRRYAVNCIKIQTELDWHPEYTFAAGIRDTVRWYLHHASWWQQILGAKYAGERLGVAA